MRLTDIIQYIQNTYGDLINENQLQSTHNDTTSIRVLGLRFKIRGDILSIRKPTRTLKQAKGYYNHLLGNNRNLIKCIQNKPMSLYCDGLGNAVGSISSAILTQGNVKYPLFGTTKIRKQMGQSLSEAYAVYIGYELISCLHRPELVSIYTDASFIVDMKHKTRNKLTPEYGIIRNIPNEVVHIPSKDNYADLYTRNRYQTFLKKRAPKVNSSQPPEILYKQESIDPESILAADKSIMERVSESIMSPKPKRPKWDPTKLGTEIMKPPQAKSNND